MTVSLGHTHEPDATHKENVPPENIWHPVVHHEENEDEMLPKPEDYAVISNPSNLVFLLYLCLFCSKVAPLQL